MSSFAPRKSVLSRSERRPGTQLLAWLHDQEADGNHKLLELRVRGFQHDLAVFAFIRVAHGSGAWRNRNRDRPAHDAVAGLWHADLRLQFRRPSLFDLYFHIGV